MRPTEDGEDEGQGAQPPGIGWKCSYFDQAECLSPLTACLYMYTPALPPILFWANYPPARLGTVPVLAVLPLEVSQSPVRNMRRTGHQCDGGTPNERDAFPNAAISTTDGAGSRPGCLPRGSREGGPD